MSKIDLNTMLPFFGFLHEARPVAVLGVALENNLVPVKDLPRLTPTCRASSQSATSTPIPAVPKLILSGFHEGAADGAEGDRYVYSGQRLVFQYTTSSSQPARRSSGQLIDQI